MDTTDWIGQGQQATDAFQQALMQRAGGAQYQSTENPNTSLQQLLGAAGNSGGSSGSNFGSNQNFSSTPDQTAIQGTNNTQDSSLVNALVAALQGQNSANAASLFNNQSNAGSGFFGTGSGGLFGGDNGGTASNAAPTASTAQSTTDTARAHGAPTPDVEARVQPTAPVQPGPPSTPGTSLNETNTMPNGSTYQWNGTTWNEMNGPGGVPVHAHGSPTQPQYQQTPYTPVSYGGYGGFVPTAPQQSMTPAQQMQQVSYIINSWRGSQAGLQQQLQNMGASSAFANALLGKGGSGAAPQPAPSPAPTSHGGAPSATHGGTASITNGGVGIIGAGYGGSNIGVGGSYVPNVTLGGYGGGAGQFGGSGGYNMAYNGGYSGIGGGSNTWTPGSSYSTAGMQALGT